MDILERIKGLNWQLWQTGVGSQVLQDAAAEIARLRAEVDSLTMELATAVQNGEALRVDAEICSDLVQIVEGHFGAVHHGVWTDRAGLRLKDTKRWARFYVMTKKLDAAIDAARGKDNG